MDTPFNGEAFRSAMRRVPAVVTIVTAAVAQERRGITIGSFTSVALEPPLISFNVGQEGRMHGVLTTASHFAVHLISQQQTHLCEHFATPDRTSAEQFSTVRHRLDAYGVPILEDALVVLRCQRHGVFEAGDHSIILGRVIEIDEANDGEPVLYYNRSYRSIGALVAQSPRTPSDFSYHGNGDQGAGHGSLVMSHRSLEKNS